MDLVVRAEKVAKAVCTEDEIKGEIGIDVRTGRSNDFLCAYQIAILRTFARHSSGLKGVISPELEKETKRARLE